MSAATHVSRLDLIDAEGLLGELKAIVLLTRMCVEHRGEVDADERDAVHFLSCLAHERVEKLDDMVQRAFQRGEAGR